MSKPEKTLAAAEIVINEKNQVLWVSRYHLKRANAIGQTFIQDCQEYLVLDSRVTFGKLGGALIEHKVRLIVDRTQEKTNHITLS